MIPKIYYFISIKFKGIVFKYLVHIRPNFPNKKPNLIDKFGFVYYINL